MKPNPKLDAVVARPVKHLSLTTARIPKIWRGMDLTREDLIKKGVQWPAWCWMPSNPFGNDPARLNRVPTIFNLAIWRLTKGIYLFDETMFQALWETPLEGDLPIELLHRLPEWCVYVPFPAPIKKSVISSQLAYGFFATLDWKADGTTVLNLGLDVDEDHDGTME